MIVCQSLPYTLVFTCGSQISVNTPARHVNVKVFYVKLWEWRFRTTLSLASAVRMTRWFYFIVIDGITSDESLTVSLYPSGCGEDEVQIEKKCLHMYSSTNRDKKITKLLFHQQ
jgi:hypothetical protein